MTPARKRRLERVENVFGSEISCEIVTPFESFDCDVADYSALGFQLICRSQAQFAQLTKSDIQAAKLSYGSHVLGAFTFPKVVRSDAQTRRVILIPSPRSTVDVVARPRRVSIPYLLEPLITGADPNRMREQLVFRVDNISEEGFRCKSSFSNRHLLQGQEFRDFSIHLPTMGSFKVSFKITNIRADESYLILGCRFIDLDRPLSKVLRNFILLSVFTKNDESVAFETERFPKKLASLLRIRRVAGEDMPDILDLRLAAYKAVNKVKSTATPQDMSDEFDANSIVLGAYIGAKLAGTARLVFSNDGSSFPFEKYFPFPTKRFRRGDSIEFSRLAVDPALQGSDMNLRLIQALAVEFMPKTDYAFLMATRELKGNYIALGAEKLAGPVPHPVVPDEELTLFVLDANRVRRGRMSALAWLFFVREPVEFMERHGFGNSRAITWIKYATLPIELFVKKSKKWLRKALRRLSR